MGHIVTGLVAKESVLQKFAALHHLHQPIKLDDALAILPLTDDNIDSFVGTPQGKYLKGFIYLSDQLVSKLCQGSHEGAIMYFETEYFGGVGTQGAAVFANGKCILEPESANVGPINQGLAMLGVRTQPPARDEFETLGLHRRRRTGDWLKEPND